MSASGTSVRVVGLVDGVAMARDGALVIDVREPAEWDSGHVAGAVHLPLAQVPARIWEVAPDRDVPVLLYCAVGSRSALAASAMAQIGYTRLANLEAPIEGWAEAGGAWEAGGDLSEAQRARYGRQLLVPEVGLAGQRALLDGRVVLVGAGGLGSPVALYLAAAGVGTIAIIDDDAIDISNLSRQILHATHRIGMHKVDSARRSLHALNPETVVETHAERLDASNVDALIDGADVVVDGTDNLDTRYLLNDAAVRLRVPVVHGSVYRWHGQVTTLVPPRGPCYRCLHPEPPPPELAPECAVAGVVGVLPGLVGMLQATEAIKLLLGAGEPLIGRLLIVDALSGVFEEVGVPRDPACPTCRDAAAPPSRR
jgi:molybdopterin/thiamine biosynthesis adenylyltransferase